MNDQNNNLGTKEYLRKYQEALLQHIFLLKKINNIIPNTKDSLNMFFFMIIKRIIESNESILILSESKKVSDVFALSRMVLELGINLGYISTRPEELIEKSLKHAHQKIYRDLDRTLEIDNLKVSIGIKDLSQVQITEKLQNAIDEYTNTNGKEVRDWTGIDKDNLFTKLKAIIKKHGEGIGTVYTLATFQIYRYSSEILHATTFGIMFSAGLTETRDKWPTKEAEILNKTYSELSNLLHILSLFTNAVSKIYLKSYPNESIEKERDELSHWLQNL